MIGNPVAMDDVDPAGFYTGKVVDVWEQLVRASQRIGRLHDARSRICNALAALADC